MSALSVQAAAGDSSQKAAHGSADTASRQFEKPLAKTGVAVIAVTAAGLVSSASGIIMRRAASRTHWDGR